MSNSLLDVITTALDDFKAHQITTIDVQEKTPITDYMVVASGNSTKHVQSIAENLVDALKKSATMDYRPRYQPDPEGEWLLVDAGDVVVHIMHPQARAFYNIEKLWDTPELVETAAMA